jgi:hypothetical protein
MTGRRPLVLLLAALALGAVFLWQRGWLVPRPQPSPRPSPRLTPRTAFRSRWKTEQEWLGDRVRARVHELLDLASTGKLSGRGADALPALADGDVLAPSRYEPIARQLLAGAVGAARTAADEREDARLLAALLDLRASVLVREDASLARQIVRQPRASGSHERAALLLGAFALRDAAGRSTDLRPALCRLTAHLAVAGALRGAGQPGTAGRVAEATLLTLAGGERDALERVDALAAEAKAPAVRAWLRALRLRNTGDWRIARDAKGLSLLERLEEFRALVKGQGDAPALVWLDRAQAEPVVDWGLIATSEGFTVETGGRFCDQALMLQLSEAMEVRSAFAGAAAEPRGLVESLGGEDSEAGGPASEERRAAPLGWPLWADRVQRHLVFALMDGAFYRETMLGLPGEAHAFAERTRSSFGRLTLYPLVLRRDARDAASYRVAMAAVRELAVRSPERLTLGDWVLIRLKEEFAPVPGDLPDETTWFRPPLPAGTLLDVGERLQALPAFRGMDDRALTALREQAPHDLDLALLAVSRLPPAKREAAALAGVFGPLAETNVRAMGKLADAAWYDVTEFRRHEGALCELVPDRCFTLGYRLAELGQADEAAIAYQKGFDRATDRVFAAQESRWLVGYYFDRGQSDKAAAVARAAAGTGSAAGMFVLASLLEKSGRLSEAEEQYRQILDRYQDAEALVGFYHRRLQAGDAASEPKLRAALALALPAGLEPFARGTLAAPPTDGVVVRKENDNTKRWGLHWGDVIVALDGYRVHDLRSYDVVNALSLEPRLRLVVWHGGHYSEVAAELWDRRFRVDMQDLALRK